MNRVIMRGLALVQAIILLLVANVAGAETSWNEIGMFYRADDFGDTAPQEVQAVLKTTIFANDPVICGTVLEQSNPNNAEKVTAALLAVRHEDHTLLLSVRGKVSVIAEDFDHDLPFRITACASPYRRDGATDATGYFFLISGNRWVGLNKGDLSIGTAFTMSSDGNNDVIGINQCMTVRKAKSFIYDSESARPYYPSISLSLNDWTIDEYPCNEAEVRDYEASHPLDWSQVYAFDCNMRENPTSRSKSYGILAKYVPVTLTGNQKQGSQMPWYEIKIGETVCWVAENYLTLHDAHERVMDSGLYAHEESDTFWAATNRSKICSVQRDTKLYSDVNMTQEIGVLQKNEIVSIAAEGNDSVLVCLSGDDPGHLVAGETYGWIQKSDVIIMDNVLQLKYGSQVR